MQKRSGIIGNLLDGESWLRIIFTFIFCLVMYILQIAVFLIGIVQSLALLFSKEPLEKLCRFGESLAIYSQQVVSYISSNSANKPFPFGEWPQVTADQNSRTPIPSRSNVGNSSTAASANLTPKTASTVSVRKSNSTKSPTSKTQEKKTTTTTAVVNKVRPATKSASTQPTATTPKVSSSAPIPPTAKPTPSDSA